MSLLLGVPTLYRYDLLDKMIASAERGTVKPRGYIVIDNGGGYRHPITLSPGVVAITTPGRNIGVAASWNRIQVSKPAGHVGSATLRGASSGSVKFINEGEQRNRAYFVQKWGGVPGSETFLTPFDGHPPEGWSERKPLH